jgi:hypothetical protein
LHWCLQQWLLVLPVQQQQVLVLLLQLLRLHLLPLLLQQ